jgi:hypothetical protein
VSLFLTTLMMCALSLKVSFLSTDKLWLDLQLKPVYVAGCVVLQLVLCAGCLKHYLVLAK